MRSGAEGGPHLGDLALAQQAQGVGQQAGDLGAERGGDLGRAGQEEVAGHDGDEVAPAGVDALHVAAHQGLVHDVVVVERGQVDELDRHRPLQVVGGGRPGDPPVAAARARPGRRRLPPAAIRWVVTSSRNGSPRADGVAELGFEPRQVVVDGRERQQGGGVHQRER